MTRTTNTTSTVNRTILTELTRARGRGRTTQEIVTKSGLERSSVSSRLSEMARNGTVATIGTRPNSQGFPVTVYAQPRYVNTN